MNEIELWNLADQLTADLAIINPDYSVVVDLTVSPTFVLLQFGIPVHYFTDPSDVIFWASTNYHHKAKLA